MTPDPIRQPLPMTMPMLPALARWRAWPRRRHWAPRGGRIDDRRRPGGVIFRRDGRIVQLIPAARQPIPRPVTYAPRFAWTVHLTTRTGERVEAANRQQPATPNPARTQLLTAFRVAARPARTGIRVEAGIAARRAGLPTPVMGPATRPPIGTGSGVAFVRTEQTLGPTLRQLAESVTERIVRGHRRIETMQQTTVVVREQPSVAVEVERALTNASRSASESTGQSSLFGAMRPAPNGFPMPDGAELDRLTDRIVSRIDDRLTAHRERMGRVF